MAWHIMGHRGDTARTLNFLRNPKDHTDVRRLAQQIDTTSEVANELQRAMRVITAGIEYPAYIKFRQLIPAIDRTLDDAVHRYYADNYAPSAEDFQFGVQFIVSAALGVADVNSYLQAPPWARR
jgi:hypothetical protein